MEIISSTNSPLPNYGTYDSLTASAFPDLKPLACTFPAHLKYSTFLYFNLTLLCYIYPFNKPVQRRNKGKLGGVVGKLWCMPRTLLRRIKQYFIIRIKTCTFGMILMLKWSNLTTLESSVYEQDK